MGPRGRPSAVRPNAGASAPGGHRQRVCPPGDARLSPGPAEPGTHNIPGIAGLLEGLRFVRRLGPETIARREHHLLRQLGEGLREMPGVQTFYAPGGVNQTGVLSFRLSGRDCEEVGEALADRGFALRAGLHCAPLAHRTAGTLDTGTVRASPCPPSAGSGRWSAFFRQCGP